MKQHRIWQDDILISPQAFLADNFFTRFRGLMIRKSLRPGESLLLRDCPAIHCCFMRFPIDVVYLDNDMKIVGIETVYPWHLGQFFPGAEHVLEMEMGCAKLLQPGMHLTIKECDAQ